MDWFNLLTLMWWVIIAVFALAGVWDHFCFRGKYERASRNAQFSIAARAVYLGWARDEQARLVMKALLALPALAMMGLRIADFWGIDAPDATNPADAVLPAIVVLRCLLIIGIGGAVFWGTHWRFQVRAERAARAVQINAGAR